MPLRVRRRAACSSTRAAPCACDPRLLPRQLWFWMKQPVTGGRHPRQAFDSYGNVVLGLQAGCASESAPADPRAASAAPPRRPGAAPARRRPAGNGRACAPAQTARSAAPTPIQVLAVRPYLTIDRPLTPARSYQASERAAGRACSRWCCWLRSASTARRSPSRWAPCAWLSCTKSSSTTKRSQTSPSARRTYEAVPGFFLLAHEQALQGRSKPSLCDSCMFKRMPPPLVTPALSGPL